MPNYQNGQIYKIISFDNPDICYIGSTTQSLCKRFGGHVANYRTYLKGGKKYTTACKICCYPDARIYLIESYNCSNRNELERREGEIIKEYQKNETLENPVNMVIAGRTNKEWRIDNQNEIKIRTKHYRENNKDEIKEYKKQYYKDNQEKIKELKKQYHINNKEKIKEKTKQYKIDNKEELKEKRKIKVNCEYCNSYVRKQDIRAHQRSKKCQSFQ